MTRLSLLAVSALICVCAASAQTPAAISTVQTTTTSPAASTSQPAPPRDPAAVALVQSAITAMGGSTVWSAIHTVQMSGTVTENIPRGKNFRWFDDWTQDFRMRRERIDPQGNVTPSVQRGANAPRSLPVLTPAAAKNHANLPQGHFDIVNEMAVQLPGAALEYALQNPQYGITSLPTAPSDPDGATTSCALIQLTSLSLIDGGVATAFCFSTSNHLPVLAFIQVPNLLPGSKIITATKRVHYSAFVSAGQVLYPSSIEVRVVGGGSASTFQIANATLNPDLSAVNFGGAK